MANYRAKKAGMALHVLKEEEQKYTVLESAGVPQRVMEWLNSSLNGDHPPCAGSTFRKLQFFLRDGTVLCKIVNKVREAAGMSPVKFQKNATTPFVAKQNIEIFNKAAVEYGVPQDLSFPSTELYDGQKSTFLKVMVCVNQLGVIANEKGFRPRLDVVQVSNGD